MKNFQIKFITNKKVSRWLQILNQLERTDLISAEKLSQIASCASKTIILDMKEIAQHFNESIRIQSGNTGYSLKITQVEEYLECKKDLVEGEPLFIVLENIFLSKLYDLDDLSDDLHISKSALTRYLRSVKNIINQYDLDFGYSPVNLLGHETNIRKFFLDFYYFSEITPHSIVLPLDIENTSRSIFCDLISEKRSSTTFLEFSYIFYMSIIRSNKGNTISFSKETHVLIKKIDLLNNLKGFFQKNQLYKLSLDEIIYICILFISNRSMDENTEKKIWHELSFSFPEIKSHILNQENLFFENNSYLIKTFFLSVKLRDLISPIYNKNLSDITEDNIKYSMEENDFFFPYISTYCQLINISSLYLKDICSNFVRLKFSIRDMNPERKRIFFILEGSPFVCQNIIANATRYLSIHQILLLDKIDFVKRSKELSDIVVTNHAEYINDIFDTNYVLFKPIPDVYDWAKLLEILNPRISEDVDFKKNY